MGQHLKGGKVKSDYIVSPHAAGSLGDLSFRKMPEYSYLWNKKQVQVQCSDRTQTLGENNK